MGPRPPATQAKAVVGRPGDRWEREAEHAADQIVAGHTVTQVTPVTVGALQRAADEEPDESVSVVDEIPVQAAPQIAVPPDEVEDGGGIQAMLDDEAVQADGPSPLTATLPTPGAGHPLPPPTRAPIERGLGADLHHVRVHDDGAARQAADDMGARAFSHGSDIYLGSGHSSHDLGLMAHESTHVVQQAGGTSAIVQRQASIKTSETWGDGSSIDTAAKRVTLKSLQVPETKKKATEANLPTDVPVGRARDTNQSTKWNTKLKSDARAASAAMLAKQELTDIQSKGHYYLVNDAAPLQPVIVTAGSLAALALRPTWDKEGTPTRFHVDHRVEHQLGGDDKETNYWLLEEQANMSSGSAIGKQLAKGLRAVFKEAREAGVVNVPAGPKAASDEGWRYSVAAISKDALRVNGRETSNWDYDEVMKGDPVLKHLRAMTDVEMNDAGGKPDKLVLFLGPQGGHREEVAWESGSGVRAMKGWWFHLNSRAKGKKHNNFAVDQISYMPGKGGAVTGTLFGKKGKNSGIQEVPNQTIKIDVRERFPWAGFLQKQGFLNEARTKLSFTGMSPLELQETDLAPDKGLVARGRLLPTVPLIASAAIDVVVDGNDVYLSKVFEAEDFDFPGPIDVTSADLELRLSPQTGFSLLGSAEFQVPRLGEGQITGEAGTNGRDVRFALTGEFNFLSDLFDPARIDVWYREGVFGGRGELGIAEGKVTGLRSASVVAEWTEGTLTATGTFATELPGVESGQLDFTYREDGTYELGGALQLGSDVPGIASGSIEASVARNEAGEWVVLGDITAVPSIPGIRSRVTGRYEKGLVTLETTAQYHRGMADGEVTVGLTNRALDEAGTPSGDPTDALRTFGGGLVSLTLAPWLAATAGLRLLPNGELEVTGEISLPDALDLFPQRTVERPLFSIGLDIPIIGFAVAGKRVGIFATIGGGADLNAYFGPAQLRDLTLGVTWNPDHEEQTTVTGHAELHLPAGAGVRLNASASIGAGIPVVSARLGLEIGGELGIDATIGASFDINWTPTTGLLLEAEARASAEPKFRFDVTGFATVDLDLWLKTINLWEKRWALGAVEVGSGMRLGMRMPVRYQEGQPFEPSLDDIEFDLPHIEPRRVLSDLVAELV